MNVVPVNVVPVNVVPDSWAVLRFLEYTEPAASLIEHLIETSIPLMSWINLGEVHYVLRRRHGEQAAADTVREGRRSPSSNPRPCGLATPSC